MRKLGTPRQLPSLSFSQLPSYPLKAELSSSPRPRPTTILPHSSPTIILLIRLLLPLSSLTGILPPHQTGGLTPSSPLRFVILIPPPHRPTLCIYKTKVPGMGACHLQYSLHAKEAFLLSAHKLGWLFIAPNCYYHPLKCPRVFSCA